jgi:hypothetical protein
VKKLLRALVWLAVFCSGALAAPDFLKVSPAKVHPGKAVTVSRSVDDGCENGHKGDSGTIYSEAFKGATHNFAGTASISAGSPQQARRVLDHDQAPQEAENRHLPCRLSLWRRQLWLGHVEGHQGLIRRRPRLLLGRAPARGWTTRDPDTELSRSGCCRVDFLTTPQSRPVTAAAGLR